MCIPKKKDDRKKNKLYRIESNRMPNKLNTNADVREYISGKKVRIVTTRFNEKTWKENENYRKEHPNIGCIYPSPFVIQTDIPYDVNLIVMEMRNDINRIIGISLIKNRSNVNTKYHVYSDPKYNQYAYLGNIRIDRTTMSYEEEEIMKVFDVLCFKGFDHLKRLKGIKAFPSYKLYCCANSANGMDLIDFLYKMFRKERTETTKELTMLEQIKT